MTSGKAQELEIVQQLVPSCFIAECRKKLESDTFLHDFIKTCMNLSISLLWKFTVIDLSLLSNQNVESFSNFWCNSMDLIFNSISDNRVNFNNISPSIAAGYHAVYFFLPTCVGENREMLISQLSINSIVDKFNCF